MFNDEIVSFEDVEEVDDLTVGLDRLKRGRELWNEILDDVEAIEFEDQMVGRKKLIFRERKVYARESYKESCWYLFMKRDLTDLNSRDAKLFRNRFTVPYQLFKQLLAHAEEWFPQKKYDVCGRETTPIFLKLL